MIRSKIVPFCLGLAIASFAFIPSHAQQPTPSAMATARELIEIKGAALMFDALIPGIVETAKNAFLPSHPQLSKELNDVAAQLRTEFAPRRAEIVNDFALLYAQNFSEQEMKEAIAFYKTTTGKKFLAQEPVVVDQALSRIKNLADKVSVEVLNRLRAEMKKKGHDL
jgi:hypothetical protein